METLQSRAKDAAAVRPRFRKEFCGVSNISFLWGGRRPTVETKHEEVLGCCYLQYRQLLEGARIAMQRIDYIAS